MSTVVGVGGKRLELPCPVAGYPIEGITWEKGEIQFEYILKQNSY